MTLSLTLNASKDAQIIKIYLHYVHAASTSVTVAEGAEIALHDVDGKVEKDLVAIVKRIAKEATSLESDLVNGFESADVK